MCGVHWPFRKLPGEVVTSQGVFKKGQAWYERINADSLTNFAQSPRSSATQNMLMREGERRPKFRKRFSESTMIKVYMKR
jgi:hypothetical protein